MRALIVGICLLMASAVYAEPIDIQNFDLPDGKVGIVYIPEEGKVEALSIVTLYSYVLPIEIGSIDVDCGYAIDNKVMAGIAYEFPSLPEMELRGINVTKYIQPSIGAGYLRDFNSDQDEVAIYATGIKVNF